MSNAAISVVMPVYNAEPYLREAIDSILGQTFTDFELLILDDGSTDGSLGIVRSYNDTRIRVLVEPHRGLEAIRNKGLQEACANYIAWIDADDRCHPERLSRQVSYMNTHADTVAVGSWAQVIDKEGRLTGQMLIPPRGGQELRLRLCTENPIINGSSMIRRDAALAVGAYRQGFPPAEDYDLWLRLSEAGEVANIAEPLYQLRIHSQSAIAREDSQKTAIRVERAQKYALERHLRGEDSLGQKLPCWQCDSKRVVRTQAANTMTLSDWGQVRLCQHRFAEGNYLLLRALKSNPFDRRAWDTIRYCYMSTATLSALAKYPRRLIFKV